MTRHPTAWIVGPFAAILIVAYVTTGHIWVALGIAAAIALAALVATCSDLLQQRIELQVDNIRLAASLDATLARLSDALDDLALAPTPLVPFASLSKPERDHIMRPDLRIIPAQRDGEHDRLPLSRDEWEAIEHETAHVEAWGDES